MVLATLWLIQRSEVNDRQMGCIPLGGKFCVRTYRRNRKIESHYCQPKVLT